MTAVRPVKVAGGDEKGRRFRLLPTDRSPDELEKEILSLWREEKLFEQTLARGAPDTVTVVAVRFREATLLDLAQADDDR